MIQSPSRHIPCLLLENVPEFPASLTSPNPPHLSSQQVDDLQGEI
ncbi:unnamed protein product [Staurois parvus]|uniref:Uncharacterized protein n=1 Tax=Staurois parvus TaxID=386267 RepID=A0ABN9E2W1_9NEOB|nr:unnamed protein product [Staurois parvus]